VFPERESTRIDAPSELQEAIHSTRTRTGFEQFLLPLTAFAMQKLAGDGTVVVLGNTVLRRDAILVQKQKLKSLQLPDPAVILISIEGFDISLATQSTRSQHDRPIDDKMDRSRLHCNDRFTRIAMATCRRSCAQALGYTHERHLSNPRQNRVSKCCLWWIPTGSSTD
jgi:hypothetical protein